MNNSEDLYPVISEKDFVASLEESWYSWNNIENEVSGQIVMSNWFEISVSSGLLEEIEDNINQPHHIKSKLDILKVLTAVAFYTIYLFRPPAWVD